MAFLVAMARRRQLWSTWYRKKRQRLTSAMGKTWGHFVRPWEMDEVKGSLKGFDIEVQEKRRDFRRKLVDPNNGSWKWHIVDQHKLACDLGKRVEDICAPTDVQHFALRQMSKQAIASAPWRQLEVPTPTPNRASAPWKPSAEVISPDYFKLLKNEGYVRVEDSFSGRKPGTGCWEDQRQTWDPVEDDAWVSWRLLLGGFRSVDQTDTLGWSALHHAIDAGTYSWRADKVARALIPLTATNVINGQTRGSRPKGYNCLHFACDGSDKGYGRHHIVEDLCRRRANLEAKDNIGNTPLLLAAGVGVTPSVDILLSWCANIHATNDNGQGALQKAKGHSGTMKALLRAGGAPETQGESGRTRTGCSQAREARYVACQMDHDLGYRWASPT